MAYPIKEPDPSALHEAEKQIALVRDRVRLVAAARITSAYIYGPAGIGKTYLIRRTLDEMDHHYRLTTGHLTAQGLFETLRNNVGSTIVLDDVTAIFQNNNARGILLAALGNESGTDGARDVSFHIGRRQQTISFTGGIIATSNQLPMGDATIAALNSRTRPLLWTPTGAQIEATMRWSVQQGWQDLTPAEAGGVAEWVIAECRRVNRPPDMRMLYEHALPYYIAFKRGLLESSWEEHVSSSISGQLKTNPKGKALTRDESAAMGVKMAAEIYEAHGSGDAAAKAWFARTGKSYRTYQRHVAALKMAT